MKQNLLAECWTHCPKVPLHCGWVQIRYSQSPGVPNRSHNIGGGPVLSYQKRGEPSRNGRCRVIFLHGSLKLDDVHFKCLLSTVLCHFKNSRRTIKIGCRIIFVLCNFEMCCLIMSCYIPQYDPSLPWAPVCPPLARVQVRGGERCAGAPHTQRCPCPQIRVSDITVVK